MKKILNGINEGHLTIFVVLLTGLITYSAYRYGDANLQEMSNRGLKLSTFMAYVFSLIKYLGTQKLDILKEIIEDQNISLAIMLAAMILGGAGCILL
jgi:hypothetical protein